MYVAWRNSQVQQELRAVRDLVEASVSLHELEDDVMPALAALEEDSSRLKKQVQQLARTMTPRGGGRLPARAERAASAEILGDAGGDSNATVERAAVLRSSIGESDVGAFLSGAALPDFSLLMSMNSLLAGSHQQPGIAGIPMTRVLMRTPPRPRAKELGTQDSDSQDDGEAEDDLSSSEGGVL